MTTLNTINIKGKKYVTVNERLKHFRENCKGYSLETEVLSVDVDSALMRAVIRDDQNRIIATGVAREVRTDTNSMVNKTSYVENCETSAWGRALANFGIGIDENVASADEVAMAITTQEKLKKVDTFKSAEVIFHGVDTYESLKKELQSITTPEALGAIATRITAIRKALTNDQLEDLRRIHISILSPQPNGSNEQ